MSERPLRRPTGANADEWHDFLSYHLDNCPPTPGDYLSFIAVQIAEAIEGCAERQTLRAERDLFAKQIGEFAERSTSDLERLRAERDAAFKLMNDIIRDATARIATLEAALRPFAKAWSDWCEANPDRVVDRCWYSTHILVPAWCDAAAALADAPGEKA